MLDIPNDLENCEFLLVQIIHPLFELYAVNIYLPHPKSKEGKQ